MKMVVALLPWLLVLLLAALYAQSSGHLRKAWARESALVESSNRVEVALRALVDSQTSLINAKQRQIVALQSIESSQERELVALREIVAIYKETAAR